mmetsp:Transcript_4360/g.10534  ORF Transcript_4360/g.10534 Transcript_4360/m.10534 type:complete len:229 (+) Transcript_4360:389-1075(+)
MLQTTRALVGHLGPLHRGAFASDLTQPGLLLHPRGGEEARADEGVCAVAPLYCGVNGVCDLQGRLRHLLPPHIRLRSGLNQPLGHRVVPRFVDLGVGFRKGILFGPRLFQRTGQMEKLGRVPWWRWAVRGSCGATKGVGQALDHVILVVCRPGGAVGCSWKCRGRQGLGKNWVGIDGVLPAVSEGNIHLVLQQLTLHSSQVPLLIIHRQDRRPHPHLPKLRPPAVPHV